MQFGGALTGVKASVDVSAAVNDFGLAENGLVAFASSTGKEFSLELPEVGNGAFTHALIEGLEHGNLLGKPTISLSELDAYVENRVKELTHGAQHPVMVHGSAIDFPVAVAEGQ